MVQAFEGCKASISMPRFWLTRTPLLRWPYLQTLLLQLLVPFCSILSATLLTYAFQLRHDKCSPRQFHHLVFIGQFSTDLGHVFGQVNVVSDALSRANSFTTLLDYHAVAGSQDQDAVLQDVLKKGCALRVERVHIPGTDVNIYCDTSTPQPRSFITTPFRRQDFNTLQVLSHTGANVTVKLVSQRFV